MLEQQKDLKILGKKDEEMEVLENYQQPNYMKWDEDKLHGDAYPAYSWGLMLLKLKCHLLHTKHVLKAFGVFMTSVSQLMIE